MGFNFGIVPAKLQGTFDDVEANTIHSSSDGTDHGFIDQDVQTTASPTFNTVNIETEGRVSVSGSDVIIENTVDDASVQLRVRENDGGPVQYIMVDADKDGVLINQNGARVNEFSIDGTLADDSDTAVPTEQAVKTYVDALTANHPHQDVQTTASPTFNGHTSTGDIVVAPVGGEGIQSLLYSINTVANQSFRIDANNAGTGTADIGILRNSDSDSELIIYAPGTAVLLARFNDLGFKLKFGVYINEFSLDGTLGGNSDDAVPTEKAVKTYADGKITTHETTYDHDDIALNTTHRTSAGTDHTFIDQDIRTTASPTFANLQLADNGRYQIGSANTIWMAENVPDNFDMFGSTALYLLSSEAGSVNIGEAVGTTGSGAVTSRLTVSNVSNHVKIRNGATFLFDTGASVNKILDQDDMISDDPNALATQQSIKAYADTKNVSNVLEYTSYNARFFGEIGEPNEQGWIEDAPTLVDTVTDTVFGQTKQVVRINDDGPSNPQANFYLTAQDWADITAFGASYGGTSRLDLTDGGNGFFSGLQSDADIGLAKKRYGFLFSNASGYLRITESDSPNQTITFDGTGGNPTVLHSEWFKWECLVPAGLGAAEFWINDILTTFAPTYNVNGGGGSSRVVVGSGASGGVDRISYHDNFGVTIFTESATKTIVDADLQGFNAISLLIPEGRRDYTIEFEDGIAGIPIGTVFQVVVNNVGGTVTAQNELTTGNVLVNGLRTNVFNIKSSAIINLTNTVDNANIYLSTRKSPVEILEFTYDVKRILYSDSVPDSSLIEEGATWLRKDSSGILYDESYVDGDFYSIIKGGA